MAGLVNNDVWVDTTGKKEVDVMAANMGMLERLDRACKGGSMSG